MLKKAKYHSTTSRSLEVISIVLIITFYIIPLIYLILAGVFSNFHILKWNNINFELIFSFTKNSKLVNSILQSFILGFASGIISTVLIFILLSTLKINNLYSKNDNLINMIFSFPDVIWALGFLIIVKSTFIVTGFKLVLLIHICFNLALAYAVLKPAFTEINQSIVLAALDFGANSITIIKKIFYPEIKFTLIGSLILCFLFSFDDFVLTFMLGGTEVQTLPLVLYSKLKYGASNEVVSLAGLSSLFAVALFIIVVLLTKRGGIFYHEKI